MKQIIQNMRTGEQAVTEIPAPRCKPGHLLIATRRSLISSGTERMLVEFSQGHCDALMMDKPIKLFHVFTVLSPSFHAEPAGLYATRLMWPPARFRSWRRDASHPVAGISVESQHKGQTPRRFWRFQRRYFAGR